MLWRRAAPFFDSDSGPFDGWTWDIQTPDTMPLGDWERLYRFLLDTHPHRYSLDQVEMPAPASAAEVFAVSREAHASLCVELPGGVEVCCLFFSTGFDFFIDPRETTTKERFNAVVDFMKAVGALMGKPLVLGAARAQEYPFLAYRPEVGEVVWVRPD